MDPFAGRSFCELKNLQVFNKQRTYLLPLPLPLLLPLRSIYTAD